MGYVNNDAEMMMGSQLAYFNFSEGDTAGEVIYNFLDEYTTIKNGKRELKSEYQGNTVIQKQFEVATNIENLGKGAAGSSNWENWVIKDICNDQNGTGYYGMLIDTGDGNAMIANRGSESYDMEQIIKDWGAADFGLLNSPITTQQARAEEYMKELWEKYGNQYDSYSVTGHSLGGNLSEHMAITAPDGMKRKIDHVTSMDGPGFSDEYIVSHKKDIEKVSDKMTHNQWSVVSSLLFPLPGVKDKVVKAHNEEGTNAIKGIFWRHDTHNVEYDENGNLIKGNRDVVSKTLGPISKSLETSLTFTFPSYITFCYTYGLLKEALRKFGEEKDTFEKKIKDFFNKYLGNDVSGQFEVKINGMLSCGQDIDSEIRQLLRVSSEVEEIRKNIRLWEEMGAYYRSKLWIINNSINDKIKDLRKLRNNLEWAAQRYQTIDCKVEAIFN